MTTKKRALVTGAAGFVGANLVRRLLADGHEVVSAPRSETEIWRLQGVASEIEIAACDLGDRDAVKRLLESAKPDWVFHLATHGAYPGQRNVSRILETNVLGTANLLNTALASGVEAFVNAGSSSEYGHKDHAPKESEALEPNSAYAVGKAAASMYCRQRAIEADAHVVTLRLYSVYGPWEEPGRLVPALVLRGLAGELPHLVDPAIARDFVYAGDVVEAFLLAANPGVARGSIYNVASGRQTSLAEAVETVRTLLGVEAEPEWGSMPNRSWDTDTWVGDIALIERDLGWRPRHDFESGLAATVEWFRRTPELRALYEK